MPYFENLVKIYPVTSLINVISPPNSGTINLTLKASDGSTNTLVIQNSSGTSISAFDFSGKLGIGNISPGALLDIGSSGSTLGTLRLEGNTSGYVQIQPSATAGSWNLTLPSSAGSNTNVLHTDGTGITSWSAIVLTTDVSGILPIANGGTNSSAALNNNRIFQSSGGAIVEAPAITASRALKSDANGIPVASTATAASLDALSGTNTGDVTLAAVGSSPNANAASLSGQVLTLQPASASFPGVVTTGTQTLAGAKTFTNAMSLGSNLINNVTDPISAQDAATKAYVDASVAALNPATSVYAATTANIPGTYSNGVSGIGATFTTTATGTFTVDGVTPPINSRILIKDQTSGFQNGIYNITTLGTIGVQTVFTRTLDYNTAQDMNNAGLIPVINGTVNSLSSWQQIATITTVGTDSLIFQEFTANPSLYLLKANNLSDVASKTTSFNNLSPMNTGGDIIYGGASGSGVRLANGSNGQVLTSSGGTSAPTWTTPTTGTVTSVALTVPSFLSVSGSPITTSGTLAVTLSGTALPIANGGTNSSTSLNNNRILKSSSGAIIEAAAITASRALISDSNGIPTHSVTTSTELTYLNGLTLQTGGIVLTDGAGLKSIAPGTSGQILTANGASPPSWITAVPIANGGTGQVTKAAAFDALQPMTTGGDLIYGGASGTGTRLANGTSGQILQSNGTTTAPSWTTNISGNAANVTGTVAIANGGTANTTLAHTVLTDGATVTWTVAGLVNNAQVTLGGNRTLAFSGATDGMTGTLVVKQDATGSRTLTLPAGSKVIGGGAGAVTLTTTANAIDILAFYYDGTNYLWTIGKNYT